MHGFNQRIQHYMNEHKAKRRYKLIAAVLSLAVIVSVCSSLIMPAISAANDESAGITTVADTETATDDGISVQSDDGDEDGSGDTETGSTGTGYVNDFTNSITGATLESTGVVTTDADGNQRLPAQLTIDFTLAENFVPADGDEEYIKNAITYRLPSNVQVDEESKSGYVTITGYPVQGTYTIDDTGLVVIKYPENFMNEYREQYIVGGLSLSCTIVKDKDDNSESLDIPIGNGNTVTAEFPAPTLAMYKSGTYNGDGTITWTLKVENPNGDDLSGYTIVDEMFPTDTDFSDYGTLSGNTLTLNSTTKKEIIITYDTPISADAALNMGTTENKATFKDTTDEVISTPSSAPGCYWPIITMEKTGTANYTSDGAEITWLITVSNTHNYDLTGFTVTDTAFANGAKPTVNGASADLDGDTLTFTSQGSSEVTITYTTNATSSDDYKNTAEINYPNAPEDSTPKTSTAEVEQAFAFSKKGSANTGKGTITWTVTLKNNNSQNTDFSFEGYTLKDEQLADATNVTVSPSGGSIDTSTGIISDVGNANEVVITYETQADSGENTNTVGIGDTNGKTVDTVSDTVKYTPRDKEYKVTGRSKDNYGNYAAPNYTDDGKAILPWEVVLQKENGDFKGKTIGDALTATENASYSDLVVYYETDGLNNWAELDSKYYTYTDNGTSFSVKLTDDAFFDNVSGIKVDYNTLIDVSDYQNLDKDVSVTVDNTAIFDGKDLPAETTFTVYNVTGYVKYDYSKGTLDDKYAATEEKSSDDLKTQKTVTIDGETYYLFNWCIKVNETGRYADGDIVTLTDTLPEGMSLYVDSSNVISIGGYNYAKPAVQRSPNDSTILGKDLGTSGTEYYSVDEENNTVTFTTNWNCGRTFYIYYDTIIKKETLDTLISEAGAGGYTIENTVYKAGEETVSQKQVYTQSESKDELTKTAKTEGLGDGYIEYTVDFNKNAATLADGKTISIDDALKTIAEDPGYASVNLTSIKFTNADTGEDITSQCTYAFDNKPALNESEHVTYSFESSNNYRNSKYKADLPTDSTSVAVFKFKALNGTKDDGTTIPGWAIWYQSDGNGFDWLDGLECEDGYYTFEMSPSGGTFYLSNCDSYFDIENSYVETYTQTHDYSATLNMTVPDETHIQITYTYYVYRQGSKDGEKVTVSNSASAESSISLGSDTAKNSINLASNSVAWSESSTSIKLKKVDSENMNVLLDASFKLFRYNSDTKTWEVATEMGDYYFKDSKVSGTTKPSTWEEVNLDLTKSDEEIWEDACALEKGAIFNTNKSTYQFNVDNGYFYMLIETNPPADYDGLKAPLYFTYGTYPTNYDTVKAAAGIGDSEVTFVEYGTASDTGVFRFENTKSISVTTDVTTTKTWSGDTPANSTATFKLIRSHTKVDTGLPTDLRDVTAADLGEQSDTVTIGADDEWTFEWTNLPSSESGNEWYYYVKEVSYTIDGTEYAVGTTGNEYSPEYENTGTSNRDIEITNEVQTPEDTSVTLPETGGSGRLGYLAGGGAIMLCGGIYFYISKRRTRFAAENKE